MQWLTVLSTTGVLTAAAGIAQALISRRKTRLDTAGEYASLSSQTVELARQTMTDLQDARAQIARLQIELEKAQSTVRALQRLIDAYQVALESHGIARPSID